MTIGQNWWHGLTRCHEESIGNTTVQQYAPTCRVVERLVTTEIESRKKAAIYTSHYKRRGSGIMDPSFIFHRCCDNNLLF